MDSAREKESIWGQMSVSPKSCVEIRLGKMLSRLGHALLYKYSVFGVSGATLSPQLTRCFLIVWPNALSSLPVSGPPFELFVVQSKGEHR